MKQALISPDEIVTYTYVDPVQSGQRVVDVADQPFPIAPPLFWMECADDVKPDYYYFDPTNQSFQPVPPMPEPVPGQEQPATTGTTEL